MVKIAILTVFKDEAHVMYEWCQYHLNFGFDHLYLIDNESNDNYGKVLQEFPEERITIFKSHGTKIQNTALRRYYGKIRDNYDWVYITDMDEFIYFNDPETTLSDFLTQQPSKIQVIFIQWKIFQPCQFSQPKSVINNNIISYSAISELDVSHTGIGKSLVNTSVPARNINNHKPTGIHTTRIKTYRVNDKIVQINHYKYNSWEVMLGVKLLRGGSKNGKDRWIFNTNPKTNHFRLNCENSDNRVDTILKDRCASLISVVSRRPQPIPPVTLYDNPIYRQVKSYLVQYPTIHAGDTQSSILEFNHYIIRLVNRITV